MFIKELEVIKRRFEQVFVTMLRTFFNLAKLLFVCVQNLTKILYSTISYQNTLLKRNLWIFKSSDWNFYSLPGYEISKYFPCELSKKLRIFKAEFEN